MATGAMHQTFHTLSERLRNARSDNDPNNPSSQAETGANKPNSAHRRIRLMGSSWFDTDNATEGDRGQRRFSHDQSVTNGVVVFVCALVLALAIFAVAASIAFGQTYPTSAPPMISRHASWSPSLQTSGPAARSLGALTEFGPDGPTTLLAETYATLLLAVAGARSG
ncbi:hypothetical protein OJ997_03655 [Solirubrobacter phytolaccae]|uniref:Uncharacterized protein n=1 Tax=Solirubrobacter phytolaccae TaxID=1404360 RepID=A0A9X3N3V7_9ACTN|nr:hypothetical protein [Solirubrobacter phytolaccae]MDA0179380.1 hypothetical protein [Solirubrobacter phytolaccae]